MSNRTIEAAKAVRKAWEKEKELVLQGKGTRDWTIEQQQSIIEKGVAFDEDGKTFEGQHMKSVEEYPEYQSDPNNIQFLTRQEHLEAHDGNWKNPSNWYYDPVTKQKTVFGKEELIPCEVTNLSNPVSPPLANRIASDREVAINQSRNEKTDNTTHLSTSGVIDEKPLQAPKQNVKKPKAVKSGGFRAFLRGAKDYIVAHPGESFLALLSFAGVVAEFVNAITGNSSGEGSNEALPKSNSFRNCESINDSSKRDSSEIAENDYNEDDYPADGKGTPKSPHIRHGHVSHRWTGPRNGEQTLKEIWIDDTPVHGGHEESCSGED